MDSTSDTATEQPAGKAMLDSFTDSVGKAREQLTGLAESLQPQLDELAIYIKDEPAKAVLMAAGAGALIAALVLAGRSRRSALPSASRIGSSLSDLVDSARDMLEQAGSAAADKVSDARKRFADTADEADDSLAKGAKQARAARDDAADAARKAAGKAAEKAADKAGDSWSDGLQSLRDARDNAIGAARKKAESAYEDLTATLQDLRGKAAPLLDRVQPPIESVADYTKASPFKALLIAAAAAALLSRVVG